MKTQDIYNAFHKEFNFLNENGFIKLNKELTWRKKDYGFDAISILVSSYKPVYVVSFNLGIRIEFLEKLMKDFEDINPDYHHQTKSIMVMQGKFSEELKKEYRIETDEELESMKIDFEKIMNDYGWNFFDKYNNIESIHEEVNSKPKEPCLLYNDKCARAMYGILVAKILNKSEFDQLVFEYRDYLKEWNEYDQGRYEKLVTYLKNEYAKR